MRFGKFSDVVNTDNWQTDIYFTPFAGIDLWLWSTEARWHFKIAQEGPKQLIEGNVPDIESIEDQEFCQPQCIIESTNHDYVSINLPGGKPGDTVSFAPGRLSSIGSLRLCEQIDWTAFNYTCSGEGGSFEWTRPPDALKQSSTFLLFNPESCPSDNVTEYGVVVHEVGNGQQALSYGDYNYMNAIDARLDICGEMPTHVNPRETWDKIVKVEVWYGDYWFNKVVKGLRATYQLIDGTQYQENFGSFKGTYQYLDIPEGAYLNKVEWYQGKYMDKVRFCLTDGYCTSYWGGNGGGYKIIYNSAGIIDRKCPVLSNTYSY